MIHHEIFDRYKLGWDYSKKQTNGKNLYLFCESSHISEELQNSLKNEIFQCVNSHLFDTFFVEEPTEYKNSHSLHYASEKEAIDGMKNNMNWPRSRIQTFYRLSKLPALYTYHSLMHGYTISRASLIDMGFSIHIASMINFFLFLGCVSII